MKTSENRLIRWAQGGVLIVVGVVVFVLELCGVNVIPDDMRDELGR